MVYKTVDGGQSWEKVKNQATDAAMKSVTFPDHMTGWAAGRGGTIIRIDNATTSADGPPSLGPSPGNYRLTNYPNPFRSATTIEYSIPVPANVQITVHDVHGRTLFQLDD